MAILHSFVGNGMQAGMMLLNIIIVESLLSVDNAAVLATMVIDLPKTQRSKALRYGIFGAYLMRGLCLFLASWLIKIWWLKPVGGLYLIYLAFSYFRSKAGGDNEEGPVHRSQSLVYKHVVSIIGPFWATVVLVEIMDIAFSIDNVFAVVAFTDDLLLICAGVFIGILAMRFVAQLFVRLIERFTFLETIAFIIIGVLGIKLSLSIYVHFYPEATFSTAMNGQSADIITSIITVGLFVVPLLTSLLFNFPRKKSITVSVTKDAEGILDKS